MAKFKKGDIVDYHSIIGGEVTSRNHEVNHVGELPSSGKVAWISGKSACVSIEALSHSNISEADKMTIRIYNANQANLEHLDTIQRQHDEYVKLLDSKRDLEKENERLKVALRKAAKTLHRETKSCPVWDGLTTFDRCTYTEGEMTCEAFSPADCYEEYFLKEAEKELARQNMQQLADQSDPIPDDIRKKMDRDRLKAEKELSDANT